jgi:hypothetical protein
MSFFYNDYDFQPDKKYLVFYRGCFSPTSSGHYSLVERYINLPNVKYLISQIGSEKRHGVPYYFNRKIWKIYINELFYNEKDKIYLEKMESPLDVLKFLHGIDTVIFLRGNEEDDNEAKERERLKKYSELIKKLKRRHINLDFLIIDRPEIETLSSTKFIEALRKNKNYHKLKYFLPKDLSYDKAMYIINRLKTFPLH